MFPLRLLLVARGTLAEGLAFPISYNILEALFVGSPGENILQCQVIERERRTMTTRNKKDNV